IKAACLTGRACGFTFNGNARGIAQYHSHHHSNCGEHYADSKDQREVGRSCTNQTGNNRPESKTQRQNNTGEGNTTSSAQTPCPGRTGAYDEANANADDKASYQQPRTVMIKQHQQVA